MKKIIKYLFLFLLLFSCETKTKLQKTKKKEVKVMKQDLIDKKVVMIIPSCDFRDEELLIPKQRLEEQGAKVIIASSKLGKVTGMLGATAEPEILFTQIKIEEYDCIIFVGGSGSTEYFNNSDAHKICKEAVEQNKLLAAICIAPTTLANSGVLANKKATVFSSQAQALKNKAAIYTGKAVEIDGNIITAEGPRAAEEFAKRIIEKLK